MKPFTSSAQTRGGRKWTGVQVVRTPNGRGRWLVPAGGSRARPKFLVAFVWQQTSGQTPSPIVSRKAPFLTPPSSSSDSTFPFQSHLFAFFLLLYPKTLPPQTSLFIPIFLQLSVPILPPTFQDVHPCLLRHCQVGQRREYLQPTPSSHSILRAMGTERERQRNKRANADPFPKF